NVRIRDRLGAHDLLAADFEYLPQNVRLRMLARVVPQILLVGHPLAKPAEFILNERRGAPRLEFEDQIVEWSREAVHLWVAAHIDLTAPMSVPHGVLVYHDRLRLIDVE